MSKVEFRGSLGGALTVKRMKKIDIDALAINISNNFICSYGQRNANKLSLAIRRLFRKKVEIKNDY